MKIIFLVILIISQNILHGQAQESLQNQLKSNAFIRLGQSKYNRGEYIKALEDFESAIKADSTNWLAFRYKGEIKRKLKDYKSAVANYTSSIELNLLDTISYKGRAESLRLLSHAEEAILDYNVALKLDSLDNQTRLGRAFCRAYLNEYWAAIKDLNICIRISPDYPVFYFQRGFMYNHLGRYKNALNDFTKSINLNTHEIKVLYSRAIAFMHLNELDSAINDFKSYLAVKSNDVEAYTGLGIAYARKLNPIMSEKYFEKAIVMDSNDSEIPVLWIKGMIINKDYSKAILMIESEFKKGHNSSKLFNLLALSKVCLRDSIGANKNWNRALQLDSLNTEVYETRMRSFIFNTKFNDIVKGDISKLIRLSNDSFSIARYYANLSLLDLEFRDTLKSSIDVNKAISYAPNEPYSFIYRAYLNYLKDQDCKKSEFIIKDLNRASFLNDHIFEPYLLKALVYSAMSRNEIACFNLKAAISRGLESSESLNHRICKGRPKKNGSSDFSFTLEFPRERSSNK